MGRQVHKTNVPAPNLMPPFQHHVPAAGRPKHASPAVLWYCPLLLHLHVWVACVHEYVRVGQNTAEV